MNEEKLGLGLLLGSFIVLGFSNGLYIAAVLCMVVLCWVMTL